MSAPASYGCCFPVCGFLVTGYYDCFHGPVGKQMQWQQLLAVVVVVVYIPAGLVRDVEFPNFLKFLTFPFGRSGG